MVGLAVLISAMWAVNLIVGFLYPGRSDPYVNAIFAIVVGAVYALGRKETPTDPPPDATSLSEAKKKLTQALEGERKADGEGGQK
jgi:hypothetical protein